MNILIEAHHPGDIHFWKYPIRELITNGHVVLMVARDRDVMRRLMEAYDWIPHIIPERRSQNNKFPLLELLSRQWTVVKAIRKFKPDVVASLFGSYCQSARILGCRNIIFTDSEFQHFNHRIAHPFAHEIHTPYCFYKELGKKQRFYDSIHELAFLDKRHYTPNPLVLHRYGLDAGAYIVVRLSSWNTLHDVNESGIGDRIYEFVDAHKAHSRILLVAEENNVPPGLEEFSAQIAPEDFHCILGFSRFVLSEGASTASESSCLGVPTVYINSTEPRGYLQMLESEYHAVQCFRTAEPGMVAAHQWLGQIEQAGLDIDLSNREDFRARLSERHIDLVDYVVRTLEHPGAADTQSSKIVVS